MKVGKLQFGKEHPYTLDETGVPKVSPMHSWKIVVIDDEPDVHQVTHMVLRGFTFDGQGLEIINGYSGADAISLIRQHPDTAVIILDVVMEEEDSGLQVVRWIREEENNHFVRIILRTGQPGQAPEGKITAEYDINDYREKGGLTVTSLTTSLISALRAYRDIRALDKTRSGLEKIIQATGNLFDARSLDELATGILTQMVAFISSDGMAVSSQGVVCFVAAEEDGVLTIRAASGKYDVLLGQPVEESVSPAVSALIQEARKNQKSVYRDFTYLGYFLSGKKSENLIYLKVDHLLRKEDQDLLNVFSLNIAAAFENLALNQEIINTQKDIIFILGEVIEARSGETGNHVRRVAESSRLMARLLGLSAHEVDMLWLASPMHDLGKIGIPDSILNKPGKLNDEEWKIIKSHPGIGSGVLKGQDREVVKAGAVISIQHHEKWDGTGYPDGLKGEEIHMFARITAIIDVVDALYHKRAYKPAWPMEKIIDLLNEERGRHFEPRLVELFLDNLEAFMSIQTKYAG